MIPKNTSFFESLNKFKVLHGVSASKHEIDEKA
jgi:hypothetical protein